MREIILNIDDSLQIRIEERARLHNRSVDEEITELLRNALEERRRVSYEVAIEE